MENFSSGDAGPIEPLHFSARRFLRRDDVRASVARDIARRDEHAVAGVERSGIQLRLPADRELLAGEAVEHADVCAASRARGHDVVEAVAIEIADGHAHAAFQLTAVRRRDDERFRAAGHVEDAHFHGGEMREDAGRRRELRGGVDALVKRLVERGGVVARRGIGAVRAIVVFTVATKVALPALAPAARLPMAKRNTPEPGAVSVQPALLAPALKVVFAGSVSVRNAPVASLLRSAAEHSCGSALVTATARSAASQWRSGLAAGHAARFRRAKARGLWRRVPRRTQNILGGTPTNLKRSGRKWWAAHG